MNKFLITVFLLFLSPSLTFPQGYLKRFIGKDSSAVANSPVGQALDQSFFVTRIGGQHLALVQAILKRSVTPYDYSSLTAAHQAARDSVWTLVIPPSYPADSVLTFDPTGKDTTIEVLDFRGDQFIMYSKLFRFQGGSMYLQRNSSTYDPMFLLAVMNGTTPVQLYGIYIDNDDNDQLKIKDATSGNDLVTFRKDGYIRRNRAIYLDAVAWFSPSTNGAVLDTVNSREEVYTFDASTQQTLYLKMALPPWFTTMDSAKALVSTPSTAGDSVAMSLAYYARAVGEAIGGTIASTQLDTIDLGTTADIILTLKFDSFTATLSPEDEVVWRLQRDVTIPNNDASAIRFHGMIFYMK